VLEAPPNPSAAMSSSRKTDRPATVPDKASVLPLSPARGPGRTTSVRPNVVTLRAKAHCIHCTLREHCLPAGLEGDDLWEFDELFEGQRRVRKGDMLFHAGGAFVALYAIRVGSLKTSILAEDGREQVAGCQMAGEIIGLDGIATGCHTCSAVALEDSEVCALPFDRLEQMAQGNPVVRNSVRQLLAAEVRRNHGHMLLLGSMRAEERVASFLLNLAERYRRRGYSASEFVLRMTREEIGSYLGLKLETVSRVFSRLQADGLIQAQGRDVKLLDPPELHHLVGRDGPPTDL
jgi:CRP/FNR family transcriptional regulator, anaerobic regulatory protein